MMEELEAYQEDFSDLDKYIIGFTENQYSRSIDRSPSPVDQTPRHSSLSFEYAERSNKNAENVFLDQSLLLDKKKTKTMNKINGNRLDLVFELTERRKVSFPPQRPINGEPFYRLDSTNSLDSENQSPSPTFPSIQVQQLPPLTQPADSVPRLPNINLDPINKKKVIRKKTKDYNNNVVRKEEITPIKIPKLVSVVNEARAVQTAAMKTEYRDETEIKSENPECIKAKDKTADENPTHEEMDNTKSNGEKVSKCVKWQDAAYKLVENIKMVKENVNSLNQHRYGRSNSVITDSTGRFRRPSFCQSSYRERADRERAYNIRRRHSLQTKTGPLDFNKLRRQISFTRSRTMAW